MDTGPCWHWLTLLYWMGRSLLSTHRHSLSTQTSNTHPYTLTHTHTRSLSILQIFLFSIVTISIHFSLSLSRSHSHSLHFYSFICNNILLNTWTIREISLNPVSECGRRTYWIHFILWYFTIKCSIMWMKRAAELLVRWMWNVPYVYTHMSIHTVDTHKSRQALFNFSSSPYFSLSHSFMYTYVCVCLARESRLSLGLPQYNSIQLNITTRETQFNSTQFEAYNPIFSFFSFYNIFIPSIQKF